MAAADIPSVEAVAIVCKYPTDLIIPLTVLNPATMVPITTAVAPTLRAKLPAQVSEIEFITLMMEITHIKYWGKYSTQSRSCSNG